jgi:phenylacetate-coenzyme A ligase PaaK-like adenylate-forming protein
VSKRRSGATVLEPIEQASRDELESLQLERLQWSVRHAYDHVAHYRQKCIAVGAHPDDLRSLSDLARFPFTTKQDLREGYPFGLFAVPRTQVVRLHASSGTTGKPTVVGYTARDIDTWASLMARSIRAAGARPGDIVHVAYGYGLFTGGLSAHFFPEIVDPETGAVLTDGEVGELVFTSLTKEALPVIRYRTRDRTQLLPPTARSMRRMAKVMGRTDDMLIIRGVNVFPSQIEELIVGQLHLAPHYVLELRRDGALDHLEVVVELDPHVANVSAVRDEAARDLQRRIKSYVGVTASVSVCNPGVIERSVGKAKRVFDRRGEGLPPVTV